MINTLTERSYLPNWLILVIFNVGGQMFNLLEGRIIEFFIGSIIGTIIGFTLWYGLDWVYNRKEVKQ